MELEQEEQIKIRLNKWIANQGFWFQLRHATGATGVKGSFSFHAVRIAARLVVFLLILLLLAFLYLQNRTSRDGFLKQFEEKIEQSLGIEELTIRRMNRTQGFLEIGRLRGEGGPETFFEAFEARNLKCRMRLLDGIAGIWDPGAIAIYRLDMQLRAGTDTPEFSAQIGDVIFREYPNINIEAIEVANANISWGYSDRARGRIQDSKMRVVREGSQWRIRFAGGRFTQNWLRGLNIEELELTATRDEIIFEKAIFSKGNATVDFSGLRVATGDQPVVKGVVKIRNLDVANILAPSVQSFLEGRVSCDLVVSGSTNSSQGLAFEGRMNMGGGTVLTVRDRIHLLKALSVVDPHNNYRKLDFNKGSFRIRTEAGGIAVKEIQLEADDLVTIAGDFIARPPNMEELDQMMAGRDFDELGSATSQAGMEIEDLRFQDLSEFERQILTRQHAELGLATSATEEGFVQRFNLEDEARMVMLREVMRLSTNLRYEGTLVMTLRPNALERTETLRNTFPPNPQTGRIHLSVPLQGALEDLTFEESKAVFEMGRR